MATTGTSPLSALQGLSATKAPASAPADKAKNAAREFEQVFLSTVLAQMFSTIEQGDGPLGGGGAGGETWRSFLTDEYAKEIAKSGGIGLADQVQRELLTLQETGK